MSDHTLIPLQPCVGFTLGDGDDHIAPVQLIHMVTGFFRQAYSAGLRGEPFELYVCDSNAETNSVLFDVKAPLANVEVRAELWDLWTHYMAAVDRWNASRGSDPLGHVHAPDYFCSPC